jgi:6-phospho-beta-glucosidase
MALRKRYEPSLGQWSAETGPWTAIEAAALWPTVSRFAERLSELAPEALFVILANPTDVLAGAVAGRFGLRACGLCVEVPQLVGLLAYHLKIDPAQIQLQHIGCNHVGWVTGWHIPGHEHVDQLIDALTQAAAQPDWYPACDWFVTLLRATGHMRTSPYHVWPFDRGGWTDAIQRRMDQWAAKQIRGDSKRQMRAEALQQALRENRMISEHQPTELHPEAAPYSFPNSAASLGALVGGLAGIGLEPISIQSPNTIGQADIATDAVLEVPTRVGPAGLEPTSVRPPPSYLFDHIRLVIEQRRLIARWLARNDRDDLRDAMMLLPESAPLPGLAEVAATLPAGDR